MQCPNCQFENSNGMNFCGKCGAKLESLCPECNFANPTDYDFCGKCGHRLSLPSEPASKELSFDEKLDKIQRYLPDGLAEKILSQRSRIEGERRQVTIMFCDMKGFTPLTEKLGPDETFSLMDQVYEILIHKVNDYQGTVNELRGDGILAFFGAPIALEDAPQRAIRSALAIHREMARFNDKLKENKEIPSILLRIGINTGPVVVGTVGNDLRVQFTAVGDTINMASRMESLAEPGTTFVTEETFNLTEGFFRFEALGAKKVKGKEQPINVYRVIALSTHRTRFDVSAERGLTPFIGRDRELELLLDGFKRAKEGRGQAFSIVAEAGLGKSRLLYEFRKAITTENVTFLEGKCLSYSRNIAYQPVIDILKSSFGIGDDDGDLGIREKVRRGLEILGIDMASTLPYLLELLSVKESGIDKLSLSAEAKKHRIIEALYRNVLKGSEIRPVVMAVEDFHWIDRSSEESFKFLLDSISGARVFLILTYRPEFVHTWGGKSYHSQVNLNRLSNRESIVMITHVLGTEDISKDLEEFILEKAEGVPFFIEEFLKSLKDLQIIEKSGKTYRIARDVKTLTMPSAIQDVIMSRIDSLPNRAKGLIQTGSVAGREFSYDLIKTVTALPEQEILSYLSVLKDSELVYERGIYPQSTYVFKHALTQEVAYQSLLKEVRQRYHGEIAQVLEESFPKTAEAQPELLGYHFAEAGLAKRAIFYIRVAGEIAIQRAANVEAIAHLNKGLELLKSLPETDMRIQQKLDLHLALALALVATKGFASPEVEKVYIHARELCQQLGETEQLFHVLCGLNMFYTIRLEYKTAREMGEQLFALAQHRADSALLVEAHFRLGRSLYFIGEYQTALQHFEQGMAIYDPEQHSSHAVLYGQDPGAGCFGFAAWILSTLGYSDQGERKVQEALRLAQQIDHPFSLAIALNHVTRLYVHRQDWAVVQKRAEQLIAFAQEHKFAYWEANSKRNLGLALVKQGQEEEGIAQMQEGLDDMRS